MNKYLRACKRRCGEYMTRPDVLYDPYCMGCEVHEVLNRDEEHVQTKLINEEI